MKTLVLAEKPSVGRDLAAVLRCNEAGKGYIEGSDCIVTWAIGHLVGLADPELYDGKYKSWDIADLPIMPDFMKLVVLPSTKEQFNVIKMLMQRDDVGNLVIATDAGREGELIARYIMTLAGWRKPFTRLWISSLTEEAIKDGFKALRPGREYDRLYQAAAARSEADWLVGMNATRAYTTKFRALLTVGRVQTPTLAMIVKREHEIQKFVSQPFWTLTIDLGQFQAKWFNPESKDVKILDKQLAEQIQKQVNGAVAEVTDVTSEVKQRPHPLLYDLTELQREANRYFGFTAKKTLGIAQELYEKHKLITYPRTDSRHISNDMVSTLPGRLHVLSAGPYGKLAQQLLEKMPALDKRTVDDTKISDHHAIIPTNKPVPADLPTDAAQVYDLVARRFLAQFLPAEVKENTRVELKANNEMFEAIGTVVKEAGWSVVYRNLKDEDEKDETSLPLIQTGERYPIRTVNLKADQTKPPARYNDATLLSAMEGAGKLLDDEELKEQLKARGLGTPATRAAIIEKLIDTQYVTRQGKFLQPTPKGITTVSILPELLTSPEMTAKWEQALAKIEAGEAAADPFLKAIRHFTTQIVSQAKSETRTIQKDKVSEILCPRCGKNLIEKKGPHGVFLACPDREGCGYTQPMQKTTKKKCPECKKESMVELKGKFGPYFKCNGCGHTMSKQSKAKSSPRSDRDRERAELKVHGRNV
jgi:DNA topoisomerase-3